MTEDWLLRWHEGRIGWHEAAGNAALTKFWPAVPKGSRVLVPLCGKSPDLLWLAKQGYEVTGIELSEIAIRAFFEESDLGFETGSAGNLSWFHCKNPAITLYCGDYFEFAAQSGSATPFDALYDRASLIALPLGDRPAYIRHTQSLLKPAAQQLLITLEYDQSVAAGPPFSVPADEVRRYWNCLHRVLEHNAIDSTPPKFRDAGLAVVMEAVWVSERR